MDLTSINQNLQSEYARWIGEIGDEDPYSSANTLGIKEVLAAHFLIADFFLAEGEGIGGIGPKSLNLLHSALYRQHVGGFGIQKWTDKFAICATLLFGIIKNHPFHDANKRTAFLCALYYLFKMGRIPTTSEKEFEDFTVQIAVGKYKDRSRYRALVKQYGEADAAILYISYYLRKNTRNMDKGTYTITYRELQKILGKFGYYLDNASGNFIDVIKIKERQVGIFRKRIERVDHKVCQVGFPGWTKQVGPGALNTIRKSTELTPEYGYDSQTFYKGVEPLEELVATYQSALRNLAFR